MKKHALQAAIALLAAFILAAAAPAKKEAALNADLFPGLKFRSIGPAFNSGRIADFAVNPLNPKQYFVAVASGHIWKTDNAGITWSPVFDNYGAYSMGCLAMDPGNANVVWAGTGENNHQRALGYGNGVYKTVDGGKSWKNMGLKESRQIGMILIDPKHPDTVYVAAEGSAWGPGGDRGLYKTVDGGASWNKVLHISENTGINCMVMDPRDPDVIIASSEQRRRHVHTKIGGGPETAIHKTSDGGKTWRKVTSGLPSVDMGGIGLAISPVNPDVVYAIIEAAGAEGGLFRSCDRGESWSKMSDHTAQGQYYNEIFCDPRDVNKVYSMETVSHVTSDGGKTWKALGLTRRHVDDHALWIDPRDTAHFMIGGDGGIYETYDDGENWLFKSNLPVTQFYRVAVDESLPFYFIYGGTQDNNSLGGPSRNTSSDGVTSDEWFNTVGGDGFFSQIDPIDPNIVYAEWQYGNIVRYDRRSMEINMIKPQPRQGEKTFRWNWNAPLLLSPHSRTRLYSAANKVFRSDDRGDSWQVISDDLTAQIDRDRWPVMGKYWGADAVAKDVSTSLYGTIVAMDESPLKEGLLYVGSDDGVIQVTENAGGQWRKIEKFPGVPAHTYVSDILPSRFDENVVFASFDNILRDDFKPYVLKSMDKGRTWTSIAANLPANGTVHTITQDHVDPELLFAGTEFGVFFSADGGKEWTQLKNGIPAVAVRDIAIQRRESDLVLATFGRGFYVLDDYTPLRHVQPATIQKEMHLFPVKDALLYIQTSMKYGQGATYFTAPNPDYGAVFTYYLKETWPTRKQARQKRDKELFEKGKPITNPGWEELRAEDMEIPPYLLFTISDAQNNVIRELRAQPAKGLNRLAWDLSYPTPFPAKAEGKFNPLAKDDSGLMVMPGTYKVSVAKVIGNAVTPLGESREFTARVLANATLPAPDRPALVRFQQQVAELTRVLQGAMKLTGELNGKLAVMRQAIAALPGGHATLMGRAADAHAKLDEIVLAIRGVEPKASDEEIPPAAVPLWSRLSTIIYNQYATTAAPGKAQEEGVRIVSEELAPLLLKLKRIAAEDIPALEKELDAARAPWTPGRLLEMKG
ncbi:MAG: glycosyl hydrolase [Acidobacteria bacterium]|nr:glycosyl hydrolase [Acidobacteriota bacterium]